MHGITMNESDPNTKSLEVVWTDLSRQKFKWGAPNVRRTSQQDVTDVTDAGRMIIRFKYDSKVATQVGIYYVYRSVKFTQLTINDNVE